MRSDDRYVEFLRMVRQKADIDQDIALLRVFDILVWMSAAHDLEECRDEQA